MDFFFAISEPKRRRIVELLAGSGELSAGEICKKFDITAQAISQHLDVAGGRPCKDGEAGAEHIYRINPDPMLELERWARETTLERTLRGAPTKYWRVKKKDKNQVRIWHESDKGTDHNARLRRAQGSRLWRAWTDQSLIQKWVVARGDKSDMRMECEAERRLDQHSDACRKGARPRTAVAMEGTFIEVSPQQAGLHIKCDR